MKGLPKLPNKITNVINDPELVMKEEKQDHTAELLREANKVKLATQMAKHAGKIRNDPKQTQPFNVI